MYRTEHDLLGDRQVPADALWGIHTLRATENFRTSGRCVHPELIHAYGLVKLATVRTNRAIGQWADDLEKVDAMERACEEMTAGALDKWVIVDALAGGAGTSVNMCVNEVIANRALQILGEPLGHYARISPTDDVNRHQSTNDTFPTATRVAAMRLLAELEASTITLQESFQRKEQQYAHIVKVGRTQLQDAVLTTFGRTFSAYAEAMNRDRWRIYKCNERLRVVNLGGTAIGTGLAAPRKYIFRVTDELRAISGLNIARAENLVDATQNADVFVEVSGILKAQAATLIKIGMDMRIMASGPEAGLCEIRLPARQAGSSIMPGKVNPVMPEMLTQAAMMTIADDTAITMAAAAGVLELNAFLPLVADRLLHSISRMSRACHDFAKLAIDDLVVNETGCHGDVLASTALATALVSTLGYERVCSIVKNAKETNLTLREAVVNSRELTAEQFDALTSPEAVCRLGSE